MLLQVEAKARDEVVRLTHANTVARPRGIGMSKSLRTDWNAYLRNTEKLRKEVIDPLEKGIDVLITSAASTETLALDRQRRVNAA